MTPAYTHCLEVPEDAPGNCGGLRVAAFGSTPEQRARGIGLALAAALCVKDPDQMSESFLCRMKNILCNNLMPSLTEQAKQSRQSMIT